jgi:adenylate cyclase
MARAWLGKTQVIHKLAFGLAVGLTLTVMALAWIGPAPLVRLENLFLDLRFKLRGERPPGNDLLIVVVDEKSLKEIGRWPWSRDKQAELVRNLEQQCRQ